MSTRAVLRNAVRPGFGTEMVRKVSLRVRYGRRERGMATAWARAHAIDMAEWASARDADLWADAVRYGERARDLAAPRLRTLEEADIDLGGGGSQELLYFLARLRPADSYLETGVAAGWSTAALLTAIEENGHGHLYSSDFPYFRLDNPEQFVGCLVPTELKRNWTLRLGPDRVNLRGILAETGPIGMAHYDSDKSRPGRKQFTQAVAPHLTSDAIFVMDDINDDMFFHDYCASRAIRPAVFAYGGKFIGVFGV